MAKRKVAPKKTATKATSTKKDKADQIAFAQQVDGLTGAWDDTKKKPQTARNQGPPDIEDGPYIAQLTSARTGLQKDKTPYFQINYEIALGPHKGVKLVTFDQISVETLGNSEVTRLDVFKDRLIAIGVDTKKVALDKLTLLATHLGDPAKVIGKPYLRISVKNSKGTTERGPNKGKPFHYQNIYCNDKMTQEEFDEAAEQME